jgi:acyl-coenzyme A synthetase/AMP-(fatty) acid ligase
MASFTVPELGDPLSQKGVPAYPYEKTFEEALNEPITIRHTSGSMGLPKPIRWTHSIYATVDAQAIPPSLDGRDNIYAPMKRAQRQ